MFIGYFSAYPSSYGQITRNLHIEHIANTEFWTCDRTAYRILLFLKIERKITTGVSTALFVMPA